MRKLPVFFLALLFAVAAVGCDSNDDENNDAELFVDTWALTAISDDTGDQTEDFANLAESLTVDLEADSTFTLDLNYREDSGIQDLQLIGSYEVNAGANSLRLILPTQQLNFDYEFEDDDVVVLAAQADLVNPIFNPVTPYEGQVDVVIERQ